MHDQIGTLRTRGAARDGLALRGAAERTLAGLTLAPPALPDAAILCLRRVQARADLQQALQGRAARQAAVQAQAQMAWQSAARPAHGPVSAASPAVWFADEAELLACLAQDGLRGSLQAWWWAALLGPAVDGSAVQRRWLAQAAAAPAALRLLAAWGQAADVLRAWPTAFCTQLSAQLAGLYGVSGWPPGPAPAAAAPPRAGPARPGDALLPAAGSGQPSWQAWIEDGLDLHTLTPPQQQMWALATLLARAPAQASQPGTAAGLQAALARLLARGVPAPAAMSRPGAASAGAAAAGHQAAPLRDPNALSKGSDEALAPPTDATRRASGPRTAGEPAADAAMAPARPGAPATLVSSTTTPWSAAPPLAPPIQPALPPRIQQAPSAGPATAAHPPVSARSPHAGLLYGLRLALQLGLYGDFSQPRRPGIALPPADWLALLGLRLFGQAFQRDPLWPLLSAWAGRAATDPPGLGFQPASGQAMPAWLTAQVRQCHRLARRALPQQRQALRWLCRRPGRWVLSSGRLDAYFALVDHPLAIRQAGLDRDPGWLPAAGQSVWLHFD